MLKKKDIMKKEDKRNLVKAIKIKLKQMKPQYCKKEY